MTADATILLVLWCIALVATGAVVAALAHLVTLYQARRDKRWWRERHEAQAREEEHPTSNLAGAFPCTCGAIFYSRKTLSSHIADSPRGNHAWDIAPTPTPTPSVAHYRGKQPFTCACGARFDTSERLRWHVDAMNGGAARFHP